MERYNGVNPPFICSSCPQKTFGDCHSFLIHSVLAHDKSYVMELHNQASKRTIENPLVKELEPLKLVQQNLKKDAFSRKRKSDNRSPKSPLIDDSKKDQIKRRKTTDVQLTDYCKFCNIMIQEDFEEHLYNSHYKQKLKSVIPKQTRECSGKNIFIMYFTVF